MNANISIPYEVIERFSLRNGIPLQQSVEIHNALLNYLDEGQALKPKDHSPSLLVDEAWHAFILHTKLYSRFCQNRYGTFVHHFPMSSEHNMMSKVKDLLLQNATADCKGKCEGGNCNDTGN